jgi:hypothetical protein
MKHCRQTTIKTNVPVNCEHKYARLHSGDIKLEISIVPTSLYMMQKYIKNSAYMKDKQRGEFKINKAQLVLYHKAIRFDK